MAQYYLVKEVQRGEEWHNDFGTFQGYSLVLDGVGEPVSLNKKVPVSQEPQAGDRLYGEVEMLMSKKGRAYNKFKTEKEPDDQVKSDSGGSYEAHGDKEDSIARAVALKAAVEFLVQHGDDNSDVLGLAEVYLAWLKNSGSPAEAASTTEPATIKVEPPPAADSSKRDSPRDWSKVGQHSEEPDPDPPEDLSFLREEYDDDSN